MCCECGMGWQSQLGTSEGSGGNRRWSTVYSWRPCEEAARPEARAASSVHTMQAGTLLSGGCVCMCVCVCVCVCACVRARVRLCVRGVSDALGRRGLGWPPGQGPEQMEGAGPGGGKGVSREWTGDSEPRVSGAEVRPSSWGPHEPGPGMCSGTPCRAMVFSDAWQPGVREGADGWTGPWPGREGPARRGSVRR